MNLLINTLYLILHVLYRFLRYFFILGESLELVVFLMGAGEKVIHVSKTWSHDDDHDEN